jgi:hypothetical protein
MAENVTFTINNFSGMKSFPVIPFLLFFFFFCSSRSFSQKRESKFLIYTEVLSGGVDILAGNISETLNTGSKVSIFNIYSAKRKNPQWQIGLSLLNFGSHKFRPTDREKLVMNNYVIVTTTTNEFGTTTDTEILEEINLSYMAFSIPLIWKPMTNKKWSPFMSVEPVYYTFESDLPDIGDVLNDKDNGIGVVSRFGLDYTPPKGSLFFRFSLSVGNVPNFQLELIEGLRNIEGKGMFFTAQVGMGFNSLK